MSPWHEVLYFSFVYLLGILVSMHRETVQKAIHDKAWLFALMVLLLALLQTLFRDGFGNYHKADLFAYGGIDLLILQKIALCFFWLSILQKLTTRYQDIVMLKLIAAGSFAIFFIHPWVLIVLIGHKKCRFWHYCPGR